MFCLLAKSLVQIDDHLTWLKGRFYVDISVYTNKYDLQQSVLVGRSNEPEGCRVGFVFFARILEISATSILKTLADFMRCHLMLVAQLFLHFR